MRGRLFLAGVRGRTPISDVLDVLTVIVMDTPGEALAKWRSGLDRAVSATRARNQTPPPGNNTVGSRATWGLEPGQIEAHSRFMSSMGRGR